MKQQNKKHDDYEHRNCNDVTQVTLLILTAFIFEEKKNRIVDHEVVDEKDKGVNQQQFYNEILIETSNNVNSGSNIDSNTNGNGNGNGNSNIEIISPKNGRSINIDSNLEAIVHINHED